MSLEQKHVICRACHAQCGLIVDFKDGKPVATHGNKDNPAYAGFSCSKGRDLQNYHSYPSRLKHSLKKSSGEYVDYEWKTAAKEMAKKIELIISEHGPDSVALYIGTFGYNTFPSHAFALAFMKAIKSQMIFTSVTIDQPGKAITAALHGIWLAGGYRHKEWDGLLVMGSNPLVSMLGGVGANPAKNLHEAKKRGMKLIVIDPRVTETAKQADLHLQCNPGYDGEILACIIRTIIQEDYHDKDFIKKETKGFSDLVKAVQPFTPKKVAEFAGVTEEKLVEAARLYGSFKKADISLGTGPNMSGAGNLSEYLGKVIMSLMGHWRREGELKENVGVFVNGFPPIAAGSGSTPATGFGKKLRVRDLEESTAGLPTGALADEILTPGKGQVKALLVLGGNPMLAWPDQIKTFKAMKKLELLACFDPRKTKTGILSDYIIAPKIHYERYSTSAPNELLGNFGNGWGYEDTYGQICDPILDVPEGSNLCEEQEFFYEMAKELGLNLTINSMAFVDPNAAAQNQTIIKTDEPFPDPISIWEAILKGSPVSYTEARKDLNSFKGKRFDREPDTIQKRPDDWPGYLNIGHPIMISKLKEIALTFGSSPIADAFPFRLISRRLKDALNSAWHESSSLKKRLPHHPAYINPSDMLQLGINDGDLVEITSERSSIKCKSYSAADVKVGCLAVPHGWGTNPDEEDDPINSGGNTGRLSFNDKNFDPITGIPIMSAIPVKLSKLN